MPLDHFSLVLKATWKNLCINIWKPIKKNQIVQFFFYLQFKSKTRWNNLPIWD